jgi:hypothetical protein
MTFAMQVPIVVAAMIVVPGMAVAVDLARQ